MRVRELTLVSPRPPDMARLARSPLRPWYLTPYDEHVRGAPGRYVLDASIGGLGGCPFAPRSTGNVATEDLVYLLEGEGIDTGIELEALIGVSRWLEGRLGRELPSRVYRAA